MGKLMTYSMVSLIIILITAFILLRFEGKIKEVYAEAIEKQTCKASVKTHAALKIRYADFSGEIKCSTVRLKIDDKDESITKKKIADAMFDCWDQYGQSGEKKLELFSDDNIYCSICHRITFDKALKINNFLDYLATQQAPGQKVTYSQFLTTKKTENSAFLEELENRRISDEIDASKNNEYAVIFTYIKGKKYLGEYLEKAKYSAPGVGTIAIGFGVVKLGGVVAGGLSAIASPAVGVPVGASISSVGGLVMVVGALWTGLASYFAGVPFEHIALVNFIPYDAQYIKSLNCREIPIKQ